MHSSSSIPCSTNTLSQFSLDLGHQVFFVVPEKNHNVFFFMLAQALASWYNSVVAIVVEAEMEHLSAATPGGLPTNSLELFFLKGGHFEPSGKHAPDPLKATVLRHCGIAKRRLG